MIVILGVFKVKFEVLVYYGFFFLGKFLKGIFFGGWKFKFDFFLFIEKYMNKVSLIIYIKVKIIFELLLIFCLIYLWWCRRL